MEPETFSEPVQEEATGARNFFARLGGVFFSPREAFTEIGNAPRLVIPLIAVFLISAFGAWYLIQKVDTLAAMRASQEQAVRQGQITAEQMAMTEAAAGPIIAVTGGIGAMILCLAVAGYGRLFSMIVDAKNSFKKLFEVSLYAMIAISVVSTILMIIILQIRGQGSIDAANLTSVVASSLGSWIESAAGAGALPEFFMRLARAVDVFNIWLIALLSIGFSAVSKNLKTSSAAMYLSGAYIFFTTINAAIRSMFG